MSSLGVDSAAVAGRRKTETVVLIKRLRGDLDWITMKALDKDRTRRYNSPIDLAADLLRHLRNEPVLAASPTTAYRLRKLVRRHEIAVAAAAALITALLAGIAGTTIGLVRATRAENRAVEARDEAVAERDRAQQSREEVEEVVEFLVDLFEVSDPEESPGETLTAREILERGAERIDSELDDRPLTKARMLETMGSVYQSLGLYDVAERQKREGLAIRRRELGNDHLLVARALDGLASLAYARANYDAAESLSREALTIYRQLNGEEHPSVAGALSDVGVALSGNGDEQAAEMLYRESLAMARRLPDVDDESLEVYVRRLAIVLDTLGKTEEAGPLYRESLELCRRIYGEEHPRVAFALDNLAIFLEAVGDAELAEPLYREALAMLRRVYGAEHPEVAQTMGNLADFLIFTKGPSERGSKADFEEAETLHRAALEMNRKFRPDHPFVGDNYAALAEIRYVEGNHRESASLSREAIRIYQLKLPEGHPKMVSSKRRLGASLLELGRLDEAELLLLESYTALAALGPESENSGELDAALENLVELYQALDRPEQAAEYLALLGESEAVRQKQP